MSEIRSPRLASSIRAVATAGLGRLPEKPFFIVEMISLYCCVVRAMVRLFNRIHLTFVAKIRHFSLENTTLCVFIPKTIENTGFYPSYFSKNTSKRNDHPSEQRCAASGGWSAFVQSSWLRWKISSARLAAVRNPRSNSIRPCCASNCWLFS